MPSRSPLLLPYAELAALVAPYVTEDPLTVPSLPSDFCEGEDLDGRQRARDVLYRLWEARHGHAPMTASRMNRDTLNRAYDAHEKRVKR